MVLFGRFLLERGVITRPQLLEATQSQVVFGGRLGTNLVELGYLQVEELERHLSDHLGVPVAPREWLEDPDPDALKGMPAHLVTRHGVFPLAVEKQTLHLAMSDPRDPHQIDDSAFATGLRIEPYVISEIRLAGLLERHYGIRRQTRYIEVDSERSHGLHAGKDPDEARTPPPAAPACDEPESVVDPLAADQELIDEAAFDALQAEWQSGQMGAAGGSGHVTLPSPGPTTTEAATESMPAPSGSPVADDLAARLQAETDPRGAALAAVAFESALTKADDRDRVGRLALRLARLHARAAATFVVRGDVIAAFQGDGETIDSDIEGLLIPLRAETIFAAVAASGQPWRGRPPAAGPDGRVLGALGRRDVRESVVLPIAVRGRVINLLYADNEGEPLAETSVAALGALCRCVAQAYERLILDHKTKFA